MTRNELTQLQLAFIDEYLLCFNCCEAYRRAGYSTDCKPSTLNRNAWKVFKHEKVQTEIKRRLQEVAEDRDCLVEKMVKSCIDIMDNPDVKTSDKLKAMETLSKLIGVADKLNIESKNDTAFTITIESVGKENE